jgi:hypothetical protein
MGSKSASEASAGSNKPASSEQYPGNTIGIVSGPTMYTLRNAAAELNLDTAPTLVFFTDWGKVALKANYFEPADGGMFITGIGVIDEHAMPMEANFKPVEGDLSKPTTGSLLFITKTF